ncbi:amidohydrolase family protein [Mucilaginibacter myungsuensis]|uniref:Amidohydrolase family protein n=1 Tax=Mucilaginibacter myungsuensis TaxID=649104 RepID=A0A929KWZ9_9SPHI|nr:amidohydrolase family protein [Mucilaginibacter myungsuensis]MBE9661478.1 amidohydrolase family protein [Mucilaginibacter myungsuensis]MDN3597621.1 amidohydrolase family protein [Mucilaginibacter myungsuensis]
MKTFIADYVFPVHADPVKNGLITVDDDGKIVALSDNPSDHHNPNTEKLNGIICPGFINTHCHLELSHLKDKLTIGSGLVQFIKNVQSTRKADDAEVFAAAERSDSDMYERGIVAVGDISNSAITAPVKAKSKLYYHTFVETFSFLPARAQEIFDNGLALVEEFKPNASLTPHAPYSVSKELFKLIKNYADKNTNLLSIHNQECEDENKFYRYKLGGFLDLYDSFGLNIDFFKPQARNSLQSILPLLSSKQRILMVHNTCTNLKDIYFTKRFDKKITWCFCPNANLFIEKRLPKVELFLGQGDSLTLGTDSLASNTKLCILSEMITLQQNFPALDTARLLEWATINGAKFLGIEADKGSLQIGKTPGLNLISGLNDLKLTADSKVTRLI